MDSQIRFVWQRRFVWQKRFVRQIWKRHSLFGQSGAQRAGQLAFCEFQNADKMHWPRSFTPKAQPALQQRAQQADLADEKGGVVDGGNDGRLGKPVG